MRNLIFALITSTALVSCQSLGTNTSTGKTDSRVIEKVNKQKPKVKAKSRPKSKPQIRVEEAQERFRKRVELRRKKYSHNHDDPRHPKPTVKGEVKSTNATKKKRECSFGGKTSGLHMSIKSRLCSLSIHFGRHVNVISGCREKGSRSAPKSWHRTVVGCRAADVTIEGVSKYKIADWHWRTYSTGGTGTYTKSAAHIDSRPEQKVKWHWKQ